MGDRDLYKDVLCAYVPYTFVLKRTHVTGTDKTLKQKTTHHSARYTRFVRFRGEYRPRLYSDSGYSTAGAVLVSVKDKKHYHKIPHVNEFILMDNIEEMSVMELS